MNKNDLEVLDEINKGSTLGMDAISFLSEKVSDNAFNQILDTEYNKYKKISNRVNELYYDNTNQEPDKTNPMNKMMNWSGIQLNTITDTSISKITEILMQGTNMGIIKGHKLINQNPNLSPNVKNILQDYVSMQENSVEGLKRYL